MFKKLFIAASGILFTATALAAQDPFPASSSAGALRDWQGRDSTFVGKAVNPNAVPSSEFEGALGSAVTASYDEPVFEGTAALPTGIPSSPSEGALR